MMAILVDPWRIPPEGGDIEGDESPEVLDLHEDKQISAEGPIHYELHVQCVTGELLVSGTLKAKMKFTCSRCADRFVKEVKDTAFFCEKPVENLHETIDLTDEVRESIILGFPNYPVCKETCHGLCPRCGAKLNRGACGCKPPVEERWTAFDGLDKIEVKDGRTQKEEIEE
jgi:uncharacterized protein